MNSHVLKRVSICMGLFFGVNLFCYAAGSETDVIVTGTISSGTCEVAPSSPTVDLDVADVSDPGLTSTSQLKDKEFQITLSNCAPGDTGKTPALNISGTVGADGVMWRDTPATSGTDNNAGSAYGFILSSADTSITCVKSGDAIKAGYCDLGEAGTVATQNDISFKIGYAKNTANGATLTTGGIKTSLKFAFEYH